MKSCRSVLAIAVVAMFALVIGQVQAESIDVPGGGFAMYKPGTDYAVTATFTPGANSYAKGVGDGITLSGGTMDYSDGTSGTTIDLPGWTLVDGSQMNDLVGGGYDE